MYFFLRNHDDLAIRFDPSTTECKTGSTSTARRARARRREQEIGPEAFNVGTQCYTVRGHRK